MSKCLRSQAFPFFLKLTLIYDFFKKVPYVQGFFSFMPEKEKPSTLPDGVPDFSFADRISVATLVRLLISKGILSADEIVKEEQRTRSNEIPERDYSRSGRLKRLSARFRWSRRLTSLFFGWEWKKVHSKASKSED